MFRTTIDIETKSSGFRDITDAVNEALRDCIVKEGVCHVYLTATTAAITINENDAMLARDFISFAKKLASEKELYAHPENAHSHLLSCVFGQEKSVPFSEGKLVLGEWQRLILWEFDTRNRKRKLVLTVSGD